MTTDQTIDGVQRNTLDRALNGCGLGKTEALKELRALLDAPAKSFAQLASESAFCQKAPAALPQGEPVCWANDQQILLCSKSPREVEPENPMIHNLPRNIAGSALRTDYCNTPLYAEQPAPVAVVPDRDSLRDIIAQVIGSDTYDCVRVWSAWGVGTMSEDDFVPVVDQEERLYEIADACLDEVTRLNTK